MIFISGVVAIADSARVIELSDRYVFLLLAWQETDSSSFEIWCAY
jgi:hypothetical protein